VRIRELKVKVGDTEVETSIGDITKVSVEAIANAANSDLWMGSGVAGAIKHAGGEAIEKEAVAQGPIKPGEAVITSGGRLAARYVIHCAGMPPGSGATYSRVKASVLAGLKLASSRGVRSIAFPAMGAGVGGLKGEESANAIIDAIKEHSRHPGSVRRIVLVAFDASIARNFEDALKTLQR
jgi:O-acetyl-ADP-ribose deacetylase (regulator of RNase III)